MNSNYTVSIQFCHGELFMCAYGQRDTGKLIWVIALSWYAF